MNPNNDESMSAPSRRHFLKLSGASIVGAALLAACSSNDEVVQGSGTTVTTSVPPTAPPPTLSAEQKAADITLLSTATSFELLSIEVYDALLAKPFDTDASTLATLRTFQAQHRANAKSLATATSAAGGTASDKPNEYVKKNITDPALLNVRDAAGVLAMAQKIETMAAANCVSLASQLGTRESRQAIMAVGGSAARRVAVLNIAAAGGDLAAGAPNARLSVRNALGNAALVS